MGLPLTSPATCLPACLPATPPFPHHLPTPTTTTSETTLTTFLAFAHAFCTFDKHPPLPFKDICIFYIIIFCLCMPWPFIYFSYFYPCLFGTGSRTGTGTSFPSILLLLCSPAAFAFCTETVDWRTGTFSCLFPFSSILPFAFAFAFCLLVFLYLNGTTPASLPPSFVAHPSCSLFLTHHFALCTPTVMCLFATPFVHKLCHVCLCVYFPTFVFWLFCPTFLYLSFWTLYIIYVFLHMSHTPVWTSTPPLCPALCSMPHYAQLTPLLSSSLTCYTTCGCTVLTLLLC